MVISLERLSCFSLDKKVLALEDFLSNMNMNVGKLVAGVGLSKMYVLTGGNNYPDIDEDVTFWCVLPWVLNIFCSRSFLIHSS